MLRPVVSYSGGGKPAIPRPNQAQSLGVEVLDESALEKLSGSSISDDSPELYTTIDQ